MIVETPLYVLLARHASFKGAALCIAAGTVGYTVLTQIANLIPSYHVQLAILAFAPSGTLLFWAVARRSAACVPDALDADTAVAPRQSSRRLLVVLVLACVARSLLRVLGSSKTWEGSGVFPLAAGPVGPASLTAICLACLALVYLVFCLPGRRPLRSCTLGLIVVVGSLQVAAIGETLDLLPVAFVTATISACELFSSVLVWVAFFDCIRYARASPWRARGLMVICETLCTVATMRLLPDGMSSSVVVMIFLYATVAVLLALEKTDGAADAVDAAGEAPAEAQDTQSYDAAVQAFANRHRLSPREQDVLPLLLAGHTRTEVIAETNLSDGTIRTHITNIHKKVGVHSREELVGRFEAEEGLPVPGKQL